MATQPLDPIAPVSRATIADELALIVRRAQAHTSASSAATAIGEADRDEIICRASSGANAPDVGARVRVEGTFTGLCIQTGKALLCEDAEADERVDSVAIRALGIRSMLVAPIKEDGRVLGVLAIFSAEPHAFESAHVTLVNAFADQISAVLRTERTASTQEARPGLPATSSWETSPRAPAEIKTVIPTTADGRPAPALALAPALSDAEPDRMPGVFAKTEPAIATAAEATDRDHRPETDKHQREKEAGAFGRFLYNLRSFRLELKLVASSSDNGAAASIEPAPAGRLRFIVVGAAAVAVAIAGTATVWLKAGSRGSPSPVVHTTEPEQRYAAPSPPVIAASNPVQPVQLPARAEAEKNDSNRLRFEDRQQIQAAENRQSNAADGPLTVSVPRSSIFGKYVTSQAEPQNVVPDSTIMHDGASASNLGFLARPVNGPPPAMATSDLVKARLIHSVPPIYPEIAKMNQVSGALVLNVRVGKDGKVTSSRLVKGPILLRDAAFDAVRQWIFQPATLNGQPIEQEMQVTLHFER